MNLFQGSDSSASNIARGHLRVWDNALALRIALQRPLEAANRFPVSRDGGSAEVGKQGYSSGSEDAIRGTLSDLYDMLDCQKRSAAGSEPLSNKRRRVDFSSASDDEIWRSIKDVQTDLRQSWRPVVDKWHARLNYGSEVSKAKLKVLSTSVWDQVDRLVSDPVAVVEKSRPLLGQSKRIRASESSKEESAEGTTANGEELQRDEEVYDDMHFYSMLLKMLIQSNMSTSGLNQNDAEWSALQKYRKQHQRSNVDRKASKGRKLRYAVHPKLQNFMFPVLQRDGPSGEALGTDYSMIASSLFQ